MNRRNRLWTLCLALSLNIGCGTLSQPAKADDSPTADALQGTVQASAKAKPDAADASIPSANPMPASAAAAASAVPASTPSSDLNAQPPASAQLATPVPAGTEPPAATPAAAASSATPAPVQSLATDPTAGHPIGPTTEVIEIKETGNLYKYDGKTINERQYQGVLSFNQSYESFKKQDYVNAEKQLRRSVILYPQLTAARTDYGLVLGRMGRNEEAIVELRQAVQEETKDAGPLAVLAGVYQGTGNLAEAASIYKELVKRFPADPSTPKAKVLIKDLEGELARQAEIAKSFTNEELDHSYFPFISYDYILKWRPERFPLKIYLPSEEEAKRDPTYRAQYGRFLRSAFESWKAKTNQSVTFVFVPKPSEADIDCLWTDDITKVSRPSERGEAKVEWDPQTGLRHVQIVVLTHGTEGETTVPDSLIQIACLHEVGHSLGIMGHSPNPQDIMFCSVPTQDAQRELSLRDCDTLIHLYRQDVKIAYFFHEGKSNPNDKIVLNNQGVEFAQARNFRAARDKFEAAVKLDPNYEPAKRNLGAILNNLGNECMRAGKTEEAEACFKQAIAVQKTDPDAKRRSFTFHNYALLLKATNRLAEATTMERQYKALAPKDASASR